MPNTYEDANQTQKVSLCIADLKKEYIILIILYPLKTPPIIIIFDLYYHLD